MSETVHATAVLYRGAGLLIRGISGAGKSALAALIIERSGRLVADDRVHLAARGGRIIAAAPAAIAGRMELRGGGILRVPFERCAIVRLVVDFVADADMERLPEAHHRETVILGVTLPLQPVADASLHAVMLVEAALGRVIPHRNISLRSSPVWG